MACRRSERGQTLPLVSLCVITLMVAAALSVDIGSLAASNRRLQAVADLAALDGARELTGGACNAPINGSVGAPVQYDYVRDKVLVSAARNKFVPGGNKTMVFQLGTVDHSAASGVPVFRTLTSCLATDFPDAVLVRAGDRTAFSFGSVIGQSGRSTTREAFASRGEALAGEGAFSLGSALATIDTSRSKLLNPLLNQMLCDPAACNANLSVVSYQGLVDSRLTFGLLADQLKASGKLSLGTTSELFTTDLVIDDILQATAAVLGRDAVLNATAITALGDLTTAVTGNQTIKLGELVSADLLTGNEAADVGFNVFELVTGTAAIANGTHAVSLPSTAFNLPAGVGSVTVGFSLIEPPVIIGKTVNATKMTKQLSLTVTPTISLSSGTLTGLQLASVTGSLPITVTGGKATGTLTGVRCGAAKGIDVNVVPTAATITAGGTLTISVNTSTGTNAAVLKTIGGLLNTVAGGQTVSNTITFSGTGASTATPAGGYNRSFAYPGEFGPNGTLHVGNTTIGFDNIAYGTANLALTVNLVNLLGPLLTATVNVSASPAGLVSLLQPVTSGIDANIVQPLMQALGLDLGSADITANYLKCGKPRLG